MVGVNWNSRSPRGVASHIHSLLVGQVPSYLRPHSSWSKSLLAANFEFIWQEGCCWFPFKRDSDSKMVPILAPIERRLGLHKLLSLGPGIVFIVRDTRKDPIRNSGREARAADATVS